jgi:hypothetical protein
MKTKLIIALFLMSGFSLFAQELNIDAKIGGKGSFKKTKKVYIAAFDISQYIQTAQASTAAGGGAFAKMTVNFGGVDGDAYQAMVGEVYNATVKQLTSLGYEVVNSEEARSKLSEPEVFNEVSKPEKMISGTVTGVIVRPKNVVLSPGRGMLFANHYPKVAKQLEANTLYIMMSVNTVDFGKGSRFSKRASVNASPGLTVSGWVGGASFDGRGTAQVFPKPYLRNESEDWVGPNGLYETSKNDMPWLGSSKGKYTLQVDQAKYLAATKDLLLKMVQASIDAYHKELNN